MSGISNGIDVLTDTFLISDASIAAYRFVTGDGTDTTNILQVAKAAGADTELCLGITQALTASADQPCPVRMLGTSLLYVDGNAGAIDIGTKLVAAASGVGVAATTPDAVAQEVGAIALAPSAAVGDIILVKLVQMTLVKGTA